MGRMSLGTKTIDSNVVMIRRHDTDSRIQKYRVWIGVARHRDDGAVERDRDVSAPLLRFDLADHPDRLVAPSTRSRRRARLS